MANSGYAERSQGENGETTMNSDGIQHHQRFTSPSPTTNIFVFHSENPACAREWVLALNECGVFNQARNHGGCSFNNRPQAEHQQTHRRTTASQALPNLGKLGGMPRLMPAPPAASKEADYDEQHSQEREVVTTTGAPLLVPVIAHIKRPKNCYQEYVSRNYKDIQRENPTLPLGQVAKLLADQWHNLDEKEREEYATIANSNRLQFDDEMKEFGMFKSNKKRKTRSREKLS